jgi:hypothetical protein
MQKAFVLLIETPGYNENHDLANNDIYLFAPRISQLSLTIRSMVDAAYIIERTL